MEENYIEWLVKRKDPVYAWPVKILMIVVCALSVLAALQLLLDVYKRQIESCSGRSALSSRIVSTETVMISLHRQNPISWPICPMRSVLL